MSLMPPEPDAVRRVFTALIPPLDIMGVIMKYVM